MSWPVVKIGDVVKVNPRLPKEIDELQSVSFVAMASASEDGVLLDEEIRVLAETKKGFTYFNRSDVLLAKITPCFENGKCLRPNQISNDIGFGSTEFHVLRANPEKIDSSYLFYLVWSQKFRWLGERSMSGAAGQKRVSADFLKSFEIPLPTLEEQKRIAAILDKADAIRRKRQQAIQLADDFLKSVFLDMFGDPVTNPKGWEVVPMSELIRIQGGYAFKSTDFGKSGIPVVKIGNANKLGFTTKGISFIQPTNAQKLKQYELYPGDLLISLTGTVGKDDYANVTEVSNEYDKYYLNQRVAKISILNKTLPSNFIKFYLSHPRVKSEITKNNRGVRQANIGNADIYSLQVPVPEEPQLLKFDEIVKNVQSIRENLNRTPEQVRDLFNALSQKAFAGEL